MIFDSTKLSYAVAGIIQAWPVDGTNQASSNSAYRSRIVVGTGTQPTPDQIQSGWSTEYFLNDLGNTGTAGNSILCGYGDLWVDSSVNDFIWELTFANFLPTSNNLYLSNTVPQSYYFKNGTANWAIIWFNEALTMTSNAFPSDNFMVVPVTDITGNGVVKLETVNVNNSAPELSSVNLTISGGV